jgi:hypothetical protein
VFFVALFSYSIFSLPILTHSIGDIIFILSGIVSLAVFFLFAFFLSRITPAKFKASRASLYGSVIGIYILFNLAYFSGYIPPVPLALKEIGVYHSVVKTSSDSYKLSFEPKPWYFLFGGTSSVFHRNIGEMVYVWSSVFSPTELNLPIFNRWQYFNESRNQWITTDLLEFFVVGGRDQGYRGYSLKTNVFPGKWRVDVETLRKDLIGRIEFTIENTLAPVDDMMTEEAEVQVKKARMLQVTEAAAELEQRVLQVQ